MGAWNARRSIGLLGFMQEGYIVRLLAYIYVGVSLGPGLLIRLLPSPHRLSFDHQELGYRLSI